MTTPDFSKIFGSNATSAQVWSDANYLTGWGFLGQAPPPYQLFDDWFKNTDTKLKYLHDLATTGVVDRALMADTLTTARTIGITGKVTGTATSFDGSQNISINITAVTADNSDTVDGKHASDFAPAGYGLGGRAVSLVGVDLNTVYDSGFYWVNANCTNQPVAGGSFHLTVQGGVFSGTTPQHFTQIATQYDTGDTYTRTCVSGTWQAWKKLVTDGEIGFTQSLSANGWTKLPNGLIMQWGITNSSGTTTFPIAFPTSCIALNVDYSANCETGIGTNGNKAGYISKRSVTTTGASIKFRWPAYTHDNTTGQWQEAYAQGATYIAIGY